MRKTIAGAFSLTMVTGLIACGGVPSHTALVRGDSQETSELFDASVAGELDNRDGTSSKGDKNPYAGAVTLAFVHPFAYLVNVSFTDAWTDGPFCPWPSRRYHSCCYRLPNSGGDPPIGRNAGPVTLTNPARGMDTTIQFDPVSRVYIIFDLHPFTWGPGEVIHLTADGDEVHAFEADAPGPALITGLEPDLSSGETINIRRSADWPIAWDPGGGEDALMEVTIAASPGSEYVKCKVPDSDGGLLVPRKLLVALFRADTQGTVRAVRNSIAPANSNNASIELHIGDWSSTARVAFER